MGYYTDFELQMEGENLPSTEEVYNKMEELWGHEVLLNDIFNDTWYTHNQDMVDLSKCFPDVLFILFGFGLERDDVWKGYYKDGEYEICYAEFVFDEVSNPRIKQCL